MYKITVLMFASGFGLTSQAQDTAAVVQQRSVLASDKLPRFYVTGSRGVSKYETFFRDASSPGWTAFGNWCGMTGMFLTPRLSLETEWMQTHYKSSQQAKGVTATGQPMTDEYRFVNNAWGFPLTARYTLTQRPERRLQVEAMAGVAYVRQEIEEEQWTTLDGNITSYRYIHRTGSNIYARLGLGGRFRLTRHLELVADYSFNRVVKNVSPDTHRLVIGNPTGLTRNRSIGLRYRFNFRLPPKAAPAG